VVAEPAANVANAARRPSAALLDAFREVAGCYSASCVFSDAQDRRGVLASAIKPILPGKLTGPALTVRLSAGDLQDPLDVLDAAEPGDVVVVDACGETETAVWGGLMGSLAHLRGIAGAVINGAARDTDELRAIPFQVFCRAVVPRGTHTMLSGRRAAVDLGVPVDGGGWIVHPGDVVIADEIGVTIVPLDQAGFVLERARAQADREQATRDRIAGGHVTVEQLLQEFGRI
jgi:4-hydroxy-4-methyl-2-oxoglutarate aldolase